MTRSIGLLSPNLAPLTIGLVLIVTMAAFEALAIATVLPAAEEDLGGLALYGLIFVAYTVASLGGIWFAGRQADRRGLAAPLAAGLGLFAIGLTIGGAAPTMAVLIVARGIQGIGAGAIVTIAYATIARAYNEAQRARMFAILASAWVVPGLIGPSLSGAVAEELTWRLVFLGILPLVAIGAVFTLPALRRLGPPSEQSAVTGPIALLRETPAMVPAVLVFALLAMTFFGAEAYLPLMLSDVRDQSATIAGLALSAGTISWTTGSWFQERRKGDRRIVVAVGLVIVGIGISLLVPVAATNAPVWLAPIAWAVAGLGIGMAYPSMSLLILSQAAEQQAGAASAAINTASVVGTAAGTGLGAAVVAIGAAGAWDTAASVTIIFAAMIAFAAVATFATKRLHAAPVEA